MQKVLALFFSFFLVSNVYCISAHASAHESSESAARGVATRGAFAFVSHGQQSASVGQKYYPAKYYCNCGGARGNGCAVNIWSDETQPYDKFCADYLFKKYGLSNTCFSGIAYDDARDNVIVYMGDCQ